LLGGNFDIEIDLVNKKLISKPYSLR